MRKLATTIAVLAFAAAVAAQISPTTPTTPAPKQDSQRDQSMAQESASFRAFQQEAGGTWVSQWNYATGTPHTIYGTGLQLQNWRENSLVEARRHATWAVSHFGDLLNTGKSTFREVIGAQMGRTWTFTFDQFYNGLPVIGGRVDVRVHMTGAISMLGSTAWTIPAGFNTVPALGELQAQFQAAKALADAGYELNAQQVGKQQPRLVIWGDVNQMVPQQVALCWEVPVASVDQNGNGVIGRYYIDAQNGNVLSYHDDKFDCGVASCKFNSKNIAKRGLPIVEQPENPPAPTPTPATYTVMGWTNTGLNATTAAVNVPLPGVEVVVPGVGTLVTDANGQFTADLTAATAVTAVLNGIHSSTVVGSTAPTSVTVPLTLQPGVAATFQFLTPTATQAELAHTNAYWWVYQVNEWARSILGNSAQLNGMDAMGVNVNLAQTCNAYFTTSPTPNINFYAAGGGCNNTAFSTVMTHEWGHGLDNAYGGISNATGDGLSEGWGDIVAMYQVDDPICGAGFFTNGGYIRTGLNTTQYGTQTEVHAAGEVWQGFAWQFRTNLRASLGTAQAIAISNQVVIGSIAANATNQANAVTQVFIADDNDGNLLNGTPHYNELSAAAIFHGMPYPQRQLATISHLPLGITTQQLAPRRVLATTTSVTSTINTLNLVYNDGAAHTRAMVPTGNANEWQAMLPGRTAPSTTTYHFEGITAAGPTVRLPATGEYQANVGGADVVFYTEDFETTTANAWTHGALAGTDEWQLGTPAGKTGTSLGVTWRDPTGAYAGTRCYAYDLGLGTANGAYGTNVNNFLRSPVINCTGRTNVRLRFRRWLTVEEGIYDHANIAVNGVQVWTNPASGHTNETAWSLFEVAIPTANNNPAVQIEFQLQSDAGLQLGGWNIDNVELVASGSLPPLDATLTFLPEQQTQGNPMSLYIQTNGVAPFLLVLGDNAGPTTIPGVVTFAVGGSFVTLGGVTNGLGLFTANVNAPLGVGPTGSLWYMQVLTLDGAGNVLVSNPHTNLFVQ